MRSATSSALSSWDKNSLILAAAESVRMTGASSTPSGAGAVVTSLIGGQPFVVAVPHVAEGGRAPYGGEFTRAAPIRHQSSSAGVAGRSLNKPQRSQGRDGHGPQQRLVKG